MIHKNCECNNSNISNLLIIEIIIIPILTPIINLTIILIIIHIITSIMIVMIISLKKQFFIHTIQKKGE